MTSVKAKLTVVLRADDVIVAEVEDAILWQRVLSAVQGDGNAEFGPAPKAAPIGSESGAPIVSSSPPPANDPIGKMAREIGLDVAMIEGALSPTPEAPYIHLNSHNWEAMRKQLPARGKAALSLVAAAATLIGLWFRAAGLGNPTQAQALAVLKGIGEDDKNPSRGVRAASWLIARPGGQIQLNASEISTAVKLGKAFCSKQWTDWQAGKAKVA